MIRYSLVVNVPALVDRATSAVGVVEPGRRGAERVDRGRADSEVRVVGAVAGGV